MFNNYSRRDELDKEMKSIEKRLKTTDKSDDLEVEKKNKDIIDLEIAVQKNNKEVKILSQKIKNYLTNNIDEMCNTYKDSKYTKELKDLFKSQSYIFDNLEEFDIHDQAKMQSCFDKIYSYITDLFESKRRKALKDYNTELSQNENDQIKDIISIQSILSENTKLNNNYVSKIESQVQIC